MTPRSYSLSILMAMKRNIRTSRIIIPKAGVTMASSFNARQLNFLLKSFFEMPSRIRRGIGTLNPHAVIMN